MDRYTVLQQLGDGTYGAVVLAQRTDTGEKVAIKRMKRKYYSWGEAMRLREVQALKKLTHPNIVRLREVVRERDTLYLVFEHMRGNVYQLVRDSRALPEPALRNIVWQVLQGLQHMHRHGYFHRDLKPENLLCNGPELVKIADLGLARETRSRPPYTEYVSTRWYRAPEVLLRDRRYGAPVDLWALGCIMAELYTARPLFAGHSELDQLHRICAALGAPDRARWPHGYALADALRVRLPASGAAVAMTRLVPSASPPALALLTALLQWPPHDRPTAVQALRFPYFAVGAALALPPPGSRSRSRSRSHLKQPSDRSSVVVVRGEGAVREGDGGWSPPPQLPPQQPRDLRELRDHFADILGGAVSHETAAPPPAPAAVTLRRSVRGGGVAGAGGVTSGRRGAAGAAGAYLGAARYVAGVRIDTSLFHELTMQPHTEITVVGSEAAPVDWAAKYLR